MTALSVVIPPRVADWLISDPEAQKLVSQLFSAIPTDAEIGIDPRGFDRLMGDRSKADELWHLLRAQPGLGPTKISKLLAAKRPHLLPIYDDVISSYLGTTSQTHWEDSWQALAASDIRERLEAIRSDAATQVPSVDELSLLRVLDIVAWRAGKRASGRLAT